MEHKPQFRLDPDVNALYIRFSAGEVSRTLELEEFVYVDIDAQGEAVGVEFVNADDFMPFLRRHHGHVDISPAFLLSQLESARPANAR
jgi:uncharacterized protein YuzE